MQDEPITTAANAVDAAFAVLRAAVECAAAEGKIAGLQACHRVGRQSDQLMISLLGGLQREGAFGERGYRRPAAAVADLLGCDTSRAQRWVRVAEDVCARVEIGGQVNPPRLPATAVAFAEGAISLRHAEVLVTALNTRAARRLTLEVWAGAEETLAREARLYQPLELAAFARGYIDLLDQDGPEPDDRVPQQVNELYLRPDPAGGGTIKGTLNAANFEKVAAAVEARSKPQPDDDRTLPGRQADALGESCGHTLCFDETLPTTGGERPHVNVIIPLADLETRARSGMLDFGGPMSPTDLRVMACDSRVVPVVLGGAGQPLDVGRAMRTVPAYLRRAVVARDRGCAWPGCDRTPSWCEVHHIKKWEHHGETEITNLVMLCSFHHHLLHRDSQWTVRIHDGLPEFIPPIWIDPKQIPRRKPPPTFAA